MENCQKAGRARGRGRHSKQRRVPQEEVAKGNVASRNGPDSAQTHRHKKQYKKKKTYKK